jgi:hypothetical protein
MNITLLFFIFFGVILIVPVLRHFRASKDPSAPHGAYQALLFLVVVGGALAISCGAWFQSGQGDGLRNDLAAAVGSAQGQGRGGHLVGTSVRQGSRRGRTHRGRGLHGGK